MVDNLFILRKVIQKSRNDREVISLISYGSYTRDDFDKFSDIEFYVFIEDKAYENFDSNEWFKEIYYVENSYLNIHGITEVVFKYGIRGEFHFLPYSKAKEELNRWKGTVLIENITKTLLVDKRGELKDIISSVIHNGLVFNKEETVEELINNFANGTIFEWNVLQRKDLFRAYTLHFQNLHNLAKLISIKYNHTEHFYSPRLLETFLSKDDLKNFRECFPQLEINSLTNCLEKTVLCFLNIGKDIFNTEQKKLMEISCERIIKRAYRIEIAVIRGSKVLFIEQTHKNPDKRHWLFPGGGREIGETDLQTAIRELKEETDLDVKEIGYFHKYKTPQRDTYPFVKLFIAEYTGGKPIPGEEPEDPNGEIYQITDIKWFDLSKEEDINELIEKNGDYLSEKVTQLSHYVKNLMEEYS